jgi:hypothetical protein
LTDEEGDPHEMWTMTIFLFPFRVVAVSIGILAVFHEKALVADCRRINKDQGSTYQPDADADPAYNKPTPQATDKYGGWETLVADTHKASLQARDRELRRIVAKDS